MTRRYCVLGDPVAAVTAMEQVLADQVRVLGPDHPYTLVTRSDVARWRGEAGDPTGAVDAFERVLGDMVRVLGSDHPDTLTTRQNLSRLQRKIDDRTEGMVDEGDVAY